ncbi:MAG: aminomethyl transferase family protein [Verrucomicrobia bacterium]|nr:aminomethyl transferase family protein [Verrucomicrobiota bacterium]
MKSLYLKPTWLSAGASLDERCGTEVVSGFSDATTEYKTIRDSVGLTDFSFLSMYRLPEETAIDLLDSILACNVAKTRFGRMAHTFLSDQDGNIIADCYVANNDEEFILLCESIVEPEELDAILMENGAEAAQIENRNDTHVLLGLDGVDAWKVVRDLFGADVLGLPYLSVEMYPFEDEQVTLFRAGKTSEFGYMIMAPNTVANALCDKLQALVSEAGGGLCGVDIHNDLRLEGRFFNIQREGRVVKDPLVLGLQWMIDFEKGDFRGSEPILAKRTQGTTQKIIGVSTEGDCEAFAPGAEICHGGEAVAQVVTSCFSHVLGQKLGLAVFPVAIAYSGLEFALGAEDGAPVRTISMPPIVPKSLSVRLDEM